MPRDQKRATARSTWCRAGKIKTHLITVPKTVSCPVFKISKEKAGRLLDGRIWDKISTVMTTA